MIGDFFCQNAVPVPLSYYSNFVKRVAELFPDAEGLKARANILLPVYHVKWCCITLNEFLPVGAARRKFARSDTDNIHQEKLEQARRYIEKVRSLI